MNFISNYTVQIKYFHFILRFRKIIIKRKLYLIFDLALQKCLLDLTHFSNDLN